jgi:single-stranded-DNA-specific exonuclease
LHPLIGRILAERGWKDPAATDRFLHGTLSHLPDPLSMKGMGEAARRIRKAADSKEIVFIHGDYDVDGICAAAIMAKTVAVLGGTFLTFLPDRAEDGYGVSLQAIEKAKSGGAKLLITVDCGVTAFEEIRRARELGLDVIVMDHHRIHNGELPPADVILNPLQPGCPYPFKELCAAGLAFRLSQVLLAEGALRFADLAALATVGDVAPLVEDNRILVREGLRRLSERKNKGIRALAEAANLKAREMNTGHLGFVLGPRINAAGRMSSPEIALQLLMTENEKEAASLAAVLNEENKARQKEERSVLEEAVREAERTVNFNRDRVIVVARENWHPGVIGIVASRLVERYYRPAIVIALDGAKGKGSGRSIKGFHLFHALQSCESVLEEFGGHEQAAGLSLGAGQIALFRQRINEYAQTQTPAEIYSKIIHVDSELALSDISPSLLADLELLEPYGMGNPRPVFSTAGLRIKGKPRALSASAFKFCVTDGRAVFEALWNCRANEDHSRLGSPEALGLIYSLKKDSWNGMESIVLDVKAVNRE